LADMFLLKYFTKFHRNQTKVWQADMIDHILILTDDCPLGI